MADLFYYSKHSVSVKPLFIYILSKNRFDFCVTTSFGYGMMMSINRFGKKNDFMKQTILRLCVILLVVVMLAACGGKSASASDRTIERSDVWKLGERYPINYSALNYVVTYEIDGELFHLIITRNAKETGMSKRVTESRTVDGLVYALCDSQRKDDNGNALYSYYECYTGSFRYMIESDTTEIRIETMLSMDDAIALIGSPASPKGKVKLCETEWSALYRTEACNLNILIRPNDNGDYLKTLSDTYQAETENSESYYTSTVGDEIVYSDGKNSIHIIQANRSGQNAPNYHTLSECKAILALLGS